MQRPRYGEWGQCPELEQGTEQHLPCGREQGRGSCCVQVSACPSKSKPCWWRGKEQDSTPGQARARQRIMLTARGCCLLSPLRPQPRTAALPGARCRALCLLGQTVTANTAEPLSPTSCSSRVSVCPSTSEWGRALTGLEAAPPSPRDVGQKSIVGQCPPQLEVRGIPVGCRGSAEEIGGIHHLLQVEFTCPGDI